MSVLQARGLSYAYAGSEGANALDGLSLSVERGKRLAILGPNGSGKTTLLLHLNGTLRPHRGDVVLEGRTMGYGRSDLRAWRERVGLVLQDADDQLFAASVAEDVSFGPLNLGLSEAETRARVEAALEALGIAELTRRPTHLLSFGQKKRVALAGAVAMKPEVLLLDEPTAGLDAKGGERLLSALEELERAGTTIVFTTHDAELVYRWADHVALFDCGRVVAEGDAVSILSNRNALAPVGLELPLLAAWGLEAKKLGLLPETAPLPRSRDDLMRTLQKLSTHRVPLV